MGTRTPWDLAPPQGVLALLRLRPQVEIGTGGYTAFPACVAAVLLRVPLILQARTRRSALLPPAVHSCILFKPTPRHRRNAATQVRAVQELI